MTTETDGYAARLDRENAVFRLAASVGGDPAALVDSSAFMDQMAYVNPADAAAVAATVQRAVASDPRYAAKPAQWTAEDVKRASAAQLTEALGNGLLKDYMAEPLATAVVDGQVVAVDPNHRGMSAPPRAQPWKV